MIDEEDENIKKPKDWPCNNREEHLTDIENAVNNFIKSPSSSTRDRMIFLTTNYDFNQNSNIGRYRCTKYEAKLISDLYICGNFLGCPPLKAHMYEIIGNVIHIKKMMAMNPKLNISPSIKEYEECLFPQLRLYYFIYQRYIYNDKERFADILINFSNELFNYCDNLEDKLNLSRDYLSLINDISGFRCIKTNYIWAFNRKEIKKIYSLEAKFVKKTKQNPAKRPLKGILILSISTLILKSRNDYGKEHFVKYISKEASYKALQNHQIWMRKIDNLNDPREQKVIPEVFNKRNWIKVDWLKNINLKQTRKYHVSCFSKASNSSTMESKYGSCVYGFKNDRIADLLSPIITNRFKSKKPYLGQVISFDVLYDKNKAKEEINLLCDIVDKFPMTDEEKNSFIQEALQYWILSVKDSKWKDERERRYVLFTYNDYEYKELDLSNPNFFKIKTSIFDTPDYIFCDNDMKKVIKRNIRFKSYYNKRTSFYYCHNCLSRNYDYELEIDNNYKCNICGSKNVELVEGQRLSHW